jgi:hypothetical protein
MAPKPGGRLIVIIKHGGIAEKAFDAVEGTVDNITITVVFSYYKPNHCE